MSTTVVRHETHRTWPMRALFVALVIGAAYPAGLAAGASEPTVRFTRLPSGWQATESYALSWRYREDVNGCWLDAAKRDRRLGRFPRRLVGYSPLRLALPKRSFTTLEGAPDTPE